MQGQKVSTVDGDENRRQRAQVRVGHLPLSSPVCQRVRRRRSRLQSRHYEAVGTADDFHDADALTVPSFGQARALARIWLEMKARELAGWCVCPTLHHSGVFAPRRAGADVKRK